MDPARARTATLSRALSEQLPYPMALYWLRAQQARAPEDVYKAAEGVLRGFIALLLADVVHAPLTEADVTTLLGGADRRGLEKPSFGKRIELLRALVRMHEAVAEPVLEGVAGWWGSADGPAGVLQRLVETRNAAAHGASVRTEAELRTERHTAIAALATLLRAAPFLRTTQLVHVEGAVHLVRGRQLHGNVRRLAGAAPYMLLAEGAEWPMTFVLEERRVYMGRADGTRWVVQPFVVLGEGGRDTGGQPRPAVFDTVRRGHMHVLEPFAGVEERAELPDEAWSAVSWESLLQRRAAVVAGWVQRLQDPPKALVRMTAGDLSDGLQPGMVLDDYRLVQRLGEGGAAVVWEVEDVHDGRPYALKVLKGDVSANDAEVRRFEGEVASMKRLYSAGCSRVVGPVVSLRVDEGGVRRVVLRMPLLRETLKDHAASLRAASGGANPDEAVVRAWLAMTLEALVQLHAQGVVHRDVKPSNFLIDESGELFVSDLGVARDAARREALTRTGEVVGTDLYMAPEQRMASRDVGPAADVYALAVCIDELWLGTPRSTPGKGQVGVVADLLREMSQLDPDARPSARAALERLSSGGSPPASTWETTIARHRARAQPARGVCLAVSSPPTPDQELWLWREQTLVLGRDVARADLLLAVEPWTLPANHAASMKVSGRHLAVRRAAQGAVLEDLGSANGTFVGGSRIDAPRPVVARTPVSVAGVLELDVDVWGDAEPRALVVRRLNNQPHRRYVLSESGVGLWGQGEVGPVTRAGSMAPVRLVWHDRALVVVNADAEEVSLNGERLRRGDARYLVVNDRVGVPGVTLVVTSVRV